MACNMTRTANGLFEMTTLDLSRRRAPSGIGLLASDVALCEAGNT
jgi:hypothetical protein